MGGSSLYGPWTGVGQYTHHLVKGLHASADVEDLKLLVHGVTRAVNEPLLNPGAQEEGSSRTSSQDTGPLSQLRVAASRSTVLVKLYDVIVPLLSRWYLRKYDADSIFHSPDFILPPFKGKRVATILDLSTIKYPEYHPAARVAFINKHIRKAVSQADHILTISDYVKAEIIEEFGLGEDQVTTTYLGADDRFCPRSEQEFKAEVHLTGLEYKEYFLFLSTIEPRKNIARLLDAYEAYLASAGSNGLPLIVVGFPGWKSDDIHQRLQRLQKKGMVRYLGYVDQHLTPFLVAGARALYLPSLYEGFGLPIVEAMKAGTAVVTSRNSAMSEVAADAALLIDPHDTSELIQTMLDLTSNDDLALGLSQSGLFRSKEFTWDNCVNKTLSVYSRVQAL
jgi:glycosyltransferase involved in cell wall biosynthesis